MNPGEETVRDLKGHRIGFALRLYSLLESDADVEGRAYEETVGSNPRGDRGESFTPRNVCAMTVAMPGPDGYRRP